MRGLTPMTISLSSHVLCFLVNLMVVTPPDSGAESTMFKHRGIFHQKPKQFPCMMVLEVNRISYLFVKEVRHII